MNSLVVNTLSFGFPVATLGINILGSLLIGLAYAGGSTVISDDMRIALMSGLLGGFTTFSAFSLDSVSLFTSGRYFLGSVYLLGSVGGSLVATVLGIYIGKQVFGLS